MTGHTKNPLKAFRNHWGNKIHTISDRYYQKLLNEAGQLLAAEENAKDTDHDSPCKG